MSSFKDQFNKDREEKNAGGGDWFKMKEGDNKIRILSNPTKFFEDFKRGICYSECGFQGSMKYLTWVWDYTDNKLKLAKLSFTVMEAIFGYMNNDEYAFDNFPSPYDTTINAKGAGTKEVVYTVIPARVNSEMSPAILDEVSKKKTTDEIIEKMKAKQIEKDKANGVYENNAIRAERMKQNPGKPSEELDTIEYPEETADIDPNQIPF